MILKLNVVRGKTDFKNCELKIQIHGRNNDVIYLGI